MSRLLRLGGALWLLATFLIASQGASAQTVGQKLADCGGAGLGQISETCFVLCTGGACISNYLDLNTAVFGATGRTSTVNRIAKGTQVTIGFSDIGTTCTGTVNVFDSLVTSGTLGEIAELDVTGTGDVIITRTVPPERFITVVDNTAACTDEPTVVMVLRVVSAEAHR